MKATNETKSGHKRTFVMLTSIMLALMFAITMVAATTTINKPEASTNYTGIIAVNVTTDLTEPLNMTLYYNAAGGAATTVLTTILNDTDADTEFYSGSVSIAALSSTATYNITAMVDNGTDQESATAINGITFDSVDPTCTSGMALVSGKQIIVLQERAVFVCSCTDDLDSAPTVTRTLTKPSGDTVSVTEASYTASGTDINQIGLYTYTCAAEDYTSNTVSNAQTVRVDTDDDAGDVSDTTAGRTITSGITENKTKWIFGAIVVFVIIIAVVIILVSNDGKKKSRKRR